LSEHESLAAAPADGRHRGVSQVEIWLAEARTGSSEALGALLQGCRRYLLAMANEALDSDLRPKVAASDLVQDSFVEVQRDFAAFKGTTEQELFGWLRAILANRLANTVRRYRNTAKSSVARETAIELLPHEALLRLRDDSSPSDLVIADDEARRVQAALARVPEPLREVLVWRTWEHRSFADIGGTLDKSADAARKMWGRAVRRLAEELHKP
jgi:RNA polymerase sigma-70 factor (ECF subfamily)